MPENIRRNSRAADLRLQPFHVGLDGAGGVLVRVRAREIEELGRVVERCIRPADRVDDALQIGALAPEGLRPGRVAPRRRVFQRAPHRSEPLTLGGDVKDTP